MPSFAPCVTLFNDGIFPPEAAGAAMDSKTIVTIRPAAKFGHLRWHVAAKTDGGNLIGR
jgi:hypothetical protein